MDLAVLEFKVGEVVQCVDKGMFDNITIGKHYIIKEVSESVVLVDNDKGESSWESIQFFSKRPKIKVTKGHLKLIFFE